MQRHDAGGDLYIPSAALVFKTGLSRKERSGNAREQPPPSPENTPEVRGTPQRVSFAWNVTAPMSPLGTGSAILPGPLTPDPRRGGAAIRPERPRQGHFPHVLSDCSPPTGQTEDFYPPRREE